MMVVLKWVPLLILVVLILILLIGNIVIVQQSKAYVVERLGAFRTVWGVGLHFKIPFIERVAKNVSLKEQVVDFPPQPVITKDNVTMQIDTVIYFQITDPKLYTYGVERPMNAIENLTATTLRNIIGEMELDQSLTSRDTINAKMRAILDEAQRLSREGFDRALFDRLIRSSLGRRTRDLDSFESVCYRMCAYHFDGVDYFSFPEASASVTPEDVLQFIRQVIRPERAALSIILPNESEESA